MTDRGDGHLIRDLADVGGRVYGEVVAGGITPSGRPYAISARHYGRFLEETPVEQAGVISPTLTRLLLAFYRVPAGRDAPLERRPGRRAGTGCSFPGGRRRAAAPVLPAHR